MASATTLGRGRRTGLGALDLTILSAAYFLTTFLFAAANVAVPDIAARLSASPAQQSLVLGAFSATFAAALILFGRLGDNRGRRRIMAGGLFAVGVVSAAVGFAPNIESLIVLRAVQGVAAAAFAPQVLSTIQAVTIGGARRRGVAAVAATAGIGFCAGQLVGGALLNWNPGDLGWRTIWWLTAAIALTAAAGARWVPDSRSSDPHPLDYRGAALLAVTLLSLVTGLSVGASTGWPAWTWALLLLSAISGTVFWRAQRRDERSGGAPMIPPAVFAHRPLRVGIVMTVLFFGGYGAFVYEYAQLTEKGLGFSPALSGLALLPFGVAFAVVSILQPRVFARLGSRTMVLGGALNAVALVAIAATGLAPTHWWGWVVQPALVVSGAAQALQFGPLVAAVMASVPDSIAGLTGGLITTTQQAALAVGVATLGSGYIALAHGHSVTHAFSVILLAHVALSVLFVGCAVSLHRNARGSELPRPARAQP